MDYNKKRIKEYNDLYNDDNELTENTVDKDTSVKIEDILKFDNIADLLDDDELVKISEMCLTDLETDKRSMTDWLDTADKAMDLVSLKRKPKNTPWQNAANVKLPIITSAVVQFCARAESELIKNGQVVKYKVLGFDHDGRRHRKGARISYHLNYQIMEKMPNWQINRDKLMHELAVVGTSFTKTYYDPVDSVIKSVHVPYDCLVVNNSIESLSKAPRISHIVYLNENEIIEHQRWGLFREDFDPNCVSKDKEDTDAISHELVEQHRLLDLDGDGLPEPYIVTVHIADEKVLRIARRFEYNNILYNSKGEIKKIFPKQYFTDFHFLPNPDGSFYSFGYGTYLLDINATSNTLANQLINAGTLASTQGGLIGKDLRIKKEDMEIEPGEWVVADTANGATIAQNMVPFNYKEPSAVLFSSLQMLVEMAEKLSSVTDSLTGTADTTNTSPNTMMMLIQQGLKVYSAIQRRILRGHKEEIKKITLLNAEHVDWREYLDLVNPPQDQLQEIFKNGVFTDYDMNMIDVVPVVDSNDATQMEELARMQMEQQIIMQYLTIAPNGGIINPRAGARSAFTVLETPNIDQLVLPDPDPNQPTPEMIAMQHKMQLEIAESARKDLDTKANAAVAESEIRKNTAHAFKAVVDAEVAGKDHELESSKHDFEKIMGAAEVGLKIEDINTKKSQISGQPTKKTAISDVLTPPQGTSLPPQPANGQPSTVS